LTNDRHQIIYAWNYREWGGAQIYFMALMKEARKRYDVLALLPADSDQKLLQYLKAIDVPVEFLPASPVLDSRTGTWARVRRKAEHWRSENALVRNLVNRPGIANAVVHIDLGFWQSFTALVRLSAVTNVFTTVHTGLPAYTGLRAFRWKVKGKLLSGISRFHLSASNEDARASLRPYTTETAFQKIEVVYSGFDPDEIARAEGSQGSKDAVQAKLSIRGSGPVLMALGQFIERKGCWVLLDALKEVSKTGSNITFIWITTSMPGADVIERIGSYGLGEIFKILPANEVGPGRDDLLELLSTADVFVLPSLQEGLPIALAEAMALGLPCIATNVNAIPEAIENNVNGVLVEPNDAEALRAAITRLVENQELRKAVGAAAKRTAYEKFDERDMAARMMELYGAAFKSGH
jgi:glycosyltransferase involved in cell wall biosynthesis